MVKLNSIDSNKISEIQNNPTPAQQNFSFSRLGKASQKTVMAMYAAAFLLVVSLTATGIYLYKRFDIDSTVLIACGVAIALSVVCIVLLRTAQQLNKKTIEQGKMLSDMFDGSTAARLVTGPYDRSIYYNAALGKILGLTMESFRGVTDLRRLIAKNDQALARFDDLYESGRKGQRAEYQLPALVKGQLKWLVVSCQPLSNWTGYLQWRFEDVTERHNMQMAIAEERSKLRDFLTNAPIGFFSVDQDGLFVFANMTFASWLGTTPEKLIEGKYRLHDFLLSPPTSAKAYDFYPADQDPSATETRFKSLAGVIFPASVAQTVAVNPSYPDRLRTRTVVRDLTPERSMQAALAQSELRFQRFFEDAPVGIVLLDGKGRIHESNPVAARFFGSAQPQLLGGTFLDFIHADHHKDLKACFETVQNAVLPKAGEFEDPAFEVSLEVKVAHQPDHMLQVHIHPLARMGENIWLVVHLVDMTEQKRLERQFVQSQKMQAVGQLAGGIAHDFNNLLTAMLGFCDLLLLRHKPGDPSFADLTQIQQNANRAANLVRQLLAFSRQQTLQPKNLDMTNILSDVSQLIRRLIGENIEFSMQHSRNLGLVRVDQGQLEQVIVNLVVNARDAMKSGGHVSIRTRNETTTETIRFGVDEMPPGNWVVMEVEDTGSGIEEKILSRIFDPFFSTKEVGEGTGLGLSTVYGIVRQTGGFVSVNSVVGVGTTFGVYLPRLAEQVEATSKTVSLEDSNMDLTGSGIIMLVEDEDAVRTFGSRALKNKGYQVIEADSGESAWEILQGENIKIDLLISDVIMPKMDGPTLVTKMRVKMPNIPVIFISGYAEDRFRQHLDADNHLYYLSKPFTLKALAAKVKDVLQSDEKPESDIVMNLLD